MATSVISPSSDKRLWNALHERVESFLESRESTTTSVITNDGDSNQSKRMKEDSELLMRGFDSVAYTLSLLTGNIENALQEAKQLAKPSTSSEIIRGSETAGDKQDEKSENELHKDDEEKKGLKRKLDDQEQNETVIDNIKKQKPQLNLNKAKNLAVAMATKSASLAKELKSVKSDMGFLQERCALLEEENQRLREGFGKGVRPDDDDLVRLQLEALLAEKSKLATDNANLSRENQCLRQLVEYHQFASEDLSASYEQVIKRLSLDFSSPIAESGEDSGEDPETPKASTEVFEFPTCLDKSFAEEEVHNE